MLWFRQHAIIDRCRRFTGCDDFDDNPGAHAPGFTLSSASQTLQSFDPLDKFSFFT